MNKSIYKRIAAPLLLLLMTSCYKGYEDTSAGIVRTPAIKSVTPATNESPNGGVIPGQICTVSGADLAEIDRITIDGFDAELISTAFAEAKFIVPAGDFPQLLPTENAKPHTLGIYGKRDSENPVYKITFYVKTPLSDAYIADVTPRTGTIGSLVSVTGYNMDKVASIGFGTVWVDAASFVSISASQVRFNVPAGTYTNASAHPISLKWGSPEQTINSDISFTMIIPTADVSGQPSTGAVETPMRFTGAGFGVIDSVYVGIVKADIVSKDITEISVKAPEAEKFTENGSNTAPVQLTVTAYYGSPAQRVILASNLTFDPRPVAVPTATLFSPENGAYILHSVTVTGSNLQMVTSLSVAGTEAEITGTTTATSLTFTIPDRSYSTLTAQADGTYQANITATFGSGQSRTLGTLDIRNLYYWKNAKVYLKGKQSVFVPETGQAVSGSYWQTYLDSNTHDYTNATATPDGVRADPKAYFYMTDGGGWAKFNGPKSSPSGSSMQNIAYNNGTYMPKARGYVDVRFLVLTGANAITEALAAGLKTIPSDRWTAVNSNIPMPTRQSSSCDQNTTASPGNTNQFDVSAGYNDGGKTNVIFYKYNGAPVDGDGKVKEPTSLVALGIIVVREVNATPVDVTERYVVFDFYYEKK